MSVFKLRSNKQFVGVSKEPSDVLVSEYTGDPRDFEIANLDPRRWGPPTIIGPSADATYEALEVYGVTITASQLKELVEDLKAACRNDGPFYLTVNRQGLCFVVAGPDKRLRVNDHFGWSKYGVVPKIGSGDVWSVCDMSNGDVLLGPPTTAERSGGGGGGGGGVEMAGVWRKVVKEKEKVMEMTESTLRKLIDEKEKEAVSLKAALQALTSSGNQLPSVSLKKTFSQASGRVKSVEFHPTQPWILLGLYSGNIRILNFETQETVKSFNATDNNSPVRSAKFVPGKQWVATAADDGKIRVYDQETVGLVKEVDAHGDFIRNVSPHPMLPVLLSAGDDMVVKMWDWEKDWECTRVFEDHFHYVMQVAWNPLDDRSFATASLDNSVKLWNIGSSEPVRTLEGHAKGVNCVGYLVSPGDDKKLYVLSGSDDFSVKVWDCDSNRCVRTLEGHMDKVCAVASHPQLPIIISAAEDGTVVIWDAITFKVIDKLDYGLERVWAIGCKTGSNQMAFGCDKGTVVVNVNSS